MSDPAKSTEIEDVLASIRRLVSVDPTPSIKANAGPQKLILTSDLRVGPEGPTPAAREKPLLLNGAIDEDPSSFELPKATAGKAAFEIVTEGEDPEAGGTEASEAEDTAPDQSADRSDASASDPAPDTLEARIAELEAAVASQSAEFEPDGSEDLRQHCPDSVPGGRSAPDETTDETDDDAEALVAQFVGSDRSKTSGDDTVDPEPVADAVEESASVEKFAVDVDRSELSEEEATPEQVDSSDAPLVAKIDGPGFAAPNDAEPEPGMVEASDASDAVQADEGEDGGDVTRGGDSPGPETSDSDLLDEAALRELVSEIVRSELQGALGERITRNVRKLVRREIMRAITVRDST